VAQSAKRSDNLIDGSDVDKAPDTEAGAVAPLLAT